MADQNKKTQQKSSGEGTNNATNSSNNPPPGVSPSAPGTSQPRATSSETGSAQPIGTSSGSSGITQPGATPSGLSGSGPSGERRGSYSASGIKSTDKSTVTNKFPDGRQRVGSSTSNSPPLQSQFQGVFPEVKRTFSGRKRRQSGLFSREESTTDLSVIGSQQLIKPIPRLNSPYSHGGSPRHSSLGARIGSALTVAEIGSGAVDGSMGKHPESLLETTSSHSLASGDVFPSDDNFHHPLKDKYKPFRRKWRRFQRKYKGCIFALLSSITSSLAGYFVHNLTAHQGYDAGYCLLWRYFGVLFPGIFIVMYYQFVEKDSVFDTVWPLNEKERIVAFVLSIVRSIVDSVSVLLCYIAYKDLLQSEAATILSSKPVVVQLLAHFTLGEPCGIVPIVMSVFSALGVMIVSKPPFLAGEPVGGKGYHNRLRGVGLAVGSMLLASVIYVILRYLKDVHYSVFSLFIGTVGMAFGLILCLVYDKLVVPELGDLGYFVGMSSLFCCSSISIVIALQNEEAFVVSLVRSCDVLFSFIWEIVLQNAHPDWYSASGACLVMISVVVIFFRKYISEQDPDSKAYKRFYFLTK